jgi:hypothetical protein
VEQFFRKIRTFPESKARQKFEVFQKRMVLSQGSTIKEEGMVDKAWMNPFDDPPLRV